MSEQQALFDGAPLLVRPEPAPTIGEAFDEFHRLNPWVYDAMCTLARRMLRIGRSRIGIGMLTEVLRWHYFAATTDPNSEFRINNNYRSRYARLIMDNEPDLAGMFELRELRAA